MSLAELDSNYSFLIGPSQSNNFPNDSLLERTPPWQEEYIYGSFRRWHIIFLTSGAILSVVFFLCCVFKCRVPRTKQEIEADFIRRQLALKFRRQLNIIKHSEMDEMDLLKALDRLRSELKADTVSLAHSEAFSALSFSPAGTPTYRKGSEVDIGISLEDVQVENWEENNTVSLKDKISSYLTIALKKIKE